MIVGNADTGPDDSTSISRGRVAVLTLGCKVNQSEGSLLLDEFARAGFAPTSFDELADVYVVNTCTVTHTGDAKSRQVIRQAMRRNPRALVVATGCYATVAAQRFPIENVLIVKNRDKDALIDIVSAHLGCIETPRLDDKVNLQGLVRRPVVATRTRAMIKVQDGCDSACSYCIIPRARGRSRSVAPEPIIERVQQLVTEGIAEVVITGVDLGSYGDDLSERHDLGSLLTQILHRTRIHRIRISSVEPGDFNSTWIDLWSDTRLCPHLHVPLQSGNDSVLERMRRRYDREEYRAMVDQCRDRIPGLTVTTDIITGFPGETDEEFSDGLAFVNEIDFDGMHVFRYSRRPGTAAAAMSDTVNETEKKRRAALLGDLSEAFKEAHVRRHLGTEHEVVWEDRVDGVWRGTTENNIRVFANDSSLATNAVDRRVLVAAFSSGCWGERTRDSDRLELPLVAV
jgi:threonylcarbamoyladenosine tRNA methylthiotransferase MtaB